MATAADVAGLILDLPDHPEPGIVFKDITPLLADPTGLDAALTCMTAPFLDAAIDVVVGIEARGFVFAPAMARALGAGFIAVRKPGKLPRATIAETYELEYGTDTLELHDDDAVRAKRALIVDDVLATGGTAAACTRLLRRGGATVVGASFLLEIAPLNGRSRLDTDVHVVLGGEA